MREREQANTASCLSNREIGKNTTTTIFKRESWIRTSSKRSSNVAEITQPRAYQEQSRIPWNSDTETFSLFRRKAALAHFLQGGIGGNLTLLSLLSPALCHSLKPEGQGLASPSTCATVSAQ